MENWKLERAGDGRYHVRGGDGYRRAGLIIGGSRRYFVELAGKQWPASFASARAAGAAIVEYHASAKNFFVDVVDSGLPKAYCTPCGRGQRSPGRGNQ